MVFRLADKVRVKVVRVDLDRKRIDFDLVVSEEFDHGKGIGKRGRAEEIVPDVKPKKKSSKKKGAPKPAEEPAPRARPARKKRSRRKKAAPK